MDFWLSFPLSPCPSLVAFALPLTKLFPFIPCLPPLTCLTLWQSPPPILYSSLPPIHLLKPLSSPPSLRPFHSAPFNTPLPPPIFVSLWLSSPPSQCSFWLRLSVDPPVLVSGCATPLPRSTYFAPPLAYHPLHSALAPHPPAWAALTELSPSLRPSLIPLVLPLF